MVASKLNVYLDKHDLKKPLQSAYKKFHSCKTAPLRTVDDRRCVALLLLDLSVAFYTVDHDLLLHRMFIKFGVCGRTLDRFRFYLRDRSQFVGIYGFKSDTHALKYGVPQRSVLGPMLYLMYMCPIGAILWRHNIRLRYFKTNSCNSLIYAVPQYQLKKLQSVQNAAARLITRTRKYEHSTPVLADLHWLPIADRIKFKILLLTFKALNKQAPNYICELITRYSPSRSLRSSSAGFLDPVKFNLKNYRQRAFAVVAPKLWNVLPKDLRRCDSINSFKSQLKTYLFKSAFNLI